MTPISPKRGIPIASTITRKLSSVTFVIGVSQRLPDIIFSLLSDLGKLTGEIYSELFIREGEVTGGTLSDWRREYRQENNI